VWRGRGRGDPGNLQDICAWGKKVDGCKWAIEWKGGSIVVYLGINMECIEEDDQKYKEIKKNTEK